MKPGSRFLKPLAVVLLLLASTLVFRSVTSPDGVESAPMVIAGSTMGTYYRVTVVDLPTTGEDELRDAIEERLGAINAGMSTWDDESEICRFNRHPGTGWFSVSEETATVVAEALRVHRRSDGAFDVTVAPLVDLWGFGPGSTRGTLPDSPAIADALATIGSQHLQVRLSPPALKKDRDALRVDLSSIAKGYAVDALAATLENLGASAFLVDIGGEVLARGRKADGSRWKIAIESPTAGERALHRVVELRDQAMATSGDYRNFFEHDGRRYSQEIDPRTGRPVTHDLVSVTVLADSCMSADAWATALLVLGSEAAWEVVEREHLAALFIVRDDDGFVEVESAAFR